MKKNMGTEDRAIRSLIAAIVVALYFGNVISGTVAIALLAVSAIFILTSFLGVCPLYMVFGIRTTKSTDNK